MANLTLRISDDTSRYTLLPFLAVREPGSGVQGEADPANRIPETAPAEPAPREPMSRTMQGTPSVGQILGNATVERTLTLPDVPDIGLTVLYTPPEAVAVAADIVFVHGLKGHPLDTWLYGKIPKVAVPNNGRKKKSLRASVLGSISKFGGRKGGNRVETRSMEEATNGAAQVGPEQVPYCYWPFDLIPKDFNNVRVMAYGYDSHPTHWYARKTTQMNITQHAKQLRNTVNRERFYCRGRPLIFVAHSLGGILVKDAIIQSLEIEDQQEQIDIALSCRHIFFFGTPHLGANIASWGTMISNIVGALPGGFSTYDRLLRGLSPDSETLDIISRRFNAILNQPIERSEKIHLCSFQEGQGMGSVKGTGSKVVPDSSSAFNRTDIERVYVAQHGNHMNMCEFSSAACDPYKEFRYVLTLYLDEIEARQNLRQDQLATLSTAAQTAILKELTFDDRVARQQQLGRIVTVAPSFEWVWTSQFVTWVRSTGKLFWITGHPASGKSTLINYLTNEGRIRDMFNELYTGRCLIISFFFDYRAEHGIRNNFQGLRRSLLYQLLSYLADLAAEVRTEFSLTKRESHEWLGDDSELASILTFVLGRLKKLTILVVLFLDGLDEYQGEKVELLSLVDDLVSANVRVCFASRDESPFSLKFRAMPSLRMDKVNRPGILSFATTFLNRSLDPMTPDEKNTIDALAKDVTTKSAGVFLWARFAVLAIIDARGQGLNRHALNARLEMVPPDLENIYARIFQSMSSERRKDSGIILRLVTSAKRDILLSELFEASYLAGVLKRPSNAIVDQMELHDFAKMALAFGGGVLELCPLIVKKSSEYSNGGQSDDGRRNGEAYTTERVLHVFVKVIHRSVQTYLDKVGWSILLGDDESSTCKSLTWLKVFAAFCEHDKVCWTHPGRFESWYLHNYHVNATILAEESSVALAAPHAEVGLSDFMGLFLPQVAFEYEVETGKSSWSLTHRVMTSSFTNLHLELHRKHDSACFPRMWSHGVPLAVTSALHLAVAHKLLGFVQDEIQHNPAHSALISSCEQSALSYRQSADDATSADKDGLNLLQTAVLCSSREPDSRRSALVSFLTGVSPRLKDQDMLYAIEMAPVADVRALLSQFPPGPLQLRSTIMFHGYHAQDYQLPEPRIFGPLWALACRDGARKETTEILNMLLQRGENINGLCGTYGTVLHAALSKHLVGYWKDPQKVLSLLIQRGADPNSPGPEGNALEYLWKLANTQKHSDFGFAQRYAPLIRYLIDRGAVNERADPNGRIPSLESMLTFGTTFRLFNFGQEQYINGSTLTPEMRETCKEYCRAYDEFVRPRLARAQGRTTLQDSSENALTEQSDNACA